MADGDRPNIKLLGRGGGGGKGGGSSNSGSEAPNTLRASQYIHLVDLLCEGPIVGFVDGLKSVIVDQVALENEDGTTNIKNCQVQLQRGLPDQDPLNGFSDVESEITVGVEMRYNNPVVRSVLDTTCDSVRITVQLSALAKTNTSSGAISGSTVQIAIDIATIGGGYTRKITDTITGKTTSNYSRAYQIVFDVPGPWNVRVTRLTVDSDLVSLQNQTFWSSYTEIIDHKLIYPDSAVVGVRAPAKSFSSVPSRLYLCDLLEIPYPSNYNPDTQVYSGVWDGTFITSSHAVNNPAWVLYEIINNPRWGVRKYMKHATADKWVLYQIAQYCDGLVPDGFGGMERRYTFNGIFASSDDAIKVLQNIASVFRGMMFWASGNITFSCDMPSDPVKLFVPGNVAGGQFNYSSSGLKTRHTAVMVTWYNPQMNHAPDIEPVEDQPRILTYGYNPSSIVALGCTSRGQAHRMGKWLIDSEWAQYETATFKVSWEHADARPGQIISIADPAYAGIRAGGRILSVQMSGPNCISVHMDKPYSYTDTVYTAKVILPDGSIYISDIAENSVTTNTITFNTPISGNAPIVGAIWMLSGDVVERQFRVMSNKESNANEFDIVALFHDPTKYDRIELGLTLEVPIYTQLPTGAIKAPTNLQITETLQLVGGEAKSVCTVSWTLSIDGRVNLYQAQYFDPVQEVWLDIGQTATASVDTPPLDIGTYSFRVRSIDFGGRLSSWLTSASILVDAANFNPLDVTGFVIAVLGDNATLSWNAVSNINLDHYVIRYSSNIGGVTWNTATILVDNVHGTNVVVPTLTGTFLIKAVTAQDNESTNAAIITSNVAGILAFNEVLTQSEQPLWTGTKVDTANAGGFLQLDSVDTLADWTTLSAVITLAYGINGFALAGTYQLEAPIDLSEAYTSRVSVTLSAGGVDNSNVMASWVTLASVITLAGTDVGSWAIELEIRTTPDDPSSMGAVWSAWTPFVLGDYFARGIDFRLGLFTTQANVTPVISQFDISVDMPDRVIAGNDILCGTSGSVIAFSPALKALGGLAISAQGLATGDYYLITSKSSTGFTIAFFDSTNAPITRTFDYVAKGYGRVS